MKTTQQQTPVLHFQNDKGFTLSFKRPVNQKLAGAVRHGK